MGDAPFPPGSAPRNPPPANPNPGSTAPGSTDPGSTAAASAGSAEASAATPTTAELVQALQADRLWLLRQLDAGAWGPWRLDLAALERELGELLDRVAERG